MNPKIRATNASVRYPVLFADSKRKMKKLVDYINF